MAPRAQQLPNADEVKIPPRPSEREFKPLKKSPKFGLPMRLNKLMPGSDLPDAEAVEDETLRLRAYQLEGLNWQVGRRL